MQEVGGSIPPGSTILRRFAAMDGKPSATAVIPGRAKREPGILNNKKSGVALDSASARFAIIPE